MVSSLLNGRWRSWFFGRKLRRSLGSAGLVDVQSDSFFPMGGSACNELERATIEQIRERPDCRRFGQGRRYRAASIQCRRPKTRPCDVAHGVGLGKKAWITGEVSPTPGPATRLRGPLADIAAFRERVPLALRLPACWLPPQAQPLTATPHVGDGAHANMPRKTRPVRCPVSGPRVDVLAALDCVPEHGRKGESNTRGVLRKRKGASRRSRQTTIVVLGIQDRLETGAILRSHRHDSKVGEHSVNPCLVAASETWLQAVNPQFREPSCQFRSGLLGQSPAGAAKPTGVLIDSKRTDSYDRATASRNRSGGCSSHNLAGADGMAPKVSSG